MEDISRWTLSFFVGLASDLNCHKKIFQKTESDKVRKCLMIYTFNCSYYREYLLYLSNEHFCALFYYVGRYVLSSQIKVSWLKYWVFDIIGKLLWVVINFKNDSKSYFLLFSFKRNRIGIVHI